MLSGFKDLLWLASVLKDNLLLLVFLLVVLGNVPAIRGRSLGYLLRVCGFMLLLALLKNLNIFSAMLLSSGVIISVSLTLYTPRYSRIKYSNLSLVPLVDFFALSILAVFISSRLIEMITFWLVAELLGFFLIAYDYLVSAERTALLAAVKYLLFSMIPTDVALFIILALTGFNEAIHLPLSEIRPDLTSPIITLMLLLGFFSKAAVFPLHFWLPDAHSIAPSPASALLSGLMVKMGLYAIYVIESYPLDTFIASIMMLFSGCLTAIYGGLQAIIQQDIKRLLAYSTTSHTAAIMILLSLYIISGDVLFIDAAVLYAVTHAFFKSALFMDSGFIEILTRERDIRRLGYVSRVAATESLAVMISVLSMLGMPPTIGFLAKVITFMSISNYLRHSWLYVLLLLIISIEISLSIVYSVRYLRTHVENTARPPQEGLDLRALRMTPCITMLSATSVGFTFIIGIFNQVTPYKSEIFLELSPVLVTALLVFAFLSLYIHEIFKKSSEGQ
jgi:formate hydrogenlyase subunit 3/multisubunit Na+/H+ antiporter MnhD subunit